MDIMSYIEPWALVFVVALIALGQIIKQSTSLEVKKVNLILLIAAFGMCFAGVFVNNAAEIVTAKEIASAVLSAIVQSILVTLMSYGGYDVLKNLMAPKPEEPKEGQQFKGGRATNEVSLF